MIVTSLSKVEAPREVPMKVSADLVFWGGE